MNNVRELDTKMKLLENNIRREMDEIQNTKNEIYTNFHEHSSGVTRKFQMINESLMEKFEDYDGIISKFQDNLIRENSKFTKFISDQLETHQKNNKALYDFLNSDIVMLKEKVSIIYSRKSTSKKH